MSISYIPESTKCRLWGKAAGRCEYEGCNDALWRDDLTKHEFNAAYIAHIVADKQNGPRGHPVLSRKLRAEPSNLMLLCDVHHRLVDREDVEGHPVERLTRMKFSHERRMEIITGVSQDKHSHVLLYGANIGEHASPLSFSLAANALFPRWYPASATPIRLDMIDSPAVDHEDVYWQLEESNLLRKFRERVSPGLSDGTIGHLSIFARAPQALLMRLGTLFTDIGRTEVYQLHREPSGWSWPESEDYPEFEVEAPNEPTGPPALILSLSATITEDRIAATFGDGQPFTPWRVRLAKPRHDCISSPKQLSAFRTLARKLLDRIKTSHGEDAVLHLFPAVPVSIAVELGRVRQPKADLKWRIYDQYRQRGGFRPVLDIE